MKKIIGITIGLLWSVQPVFADDLHEQAKTEGRQYCAANAESMDSAISFLTIQTIRQAPQTMKDSLYTRELTQPSVSGLFKDGLILISRQTEGFVIGVEVDDHVLVDGDADGLVDRLRVSQSDEWSHRPNSWNQYMFCRYVYTASRYQQHKERREHIARLFPMYP